MKILCIKNETTNISPLVLPFDLSKTISDQNFIYTKEDTSSTYALTKNKKYTVYGLLFYGEEIRFLLQNDNGIPEFYPSILFDVVDNFLNYDWEMKIFSIEGKNLTVIGYHDIMDYSTLARTIQLGADAIQYFLNYKKEAQYND